VEAEILVFDFELSTGGLVQKMKSPQFYQAASFLTVLDVLFLSEAV